MANEDVVLNQDALADKGMAGYLTALADAGVLLDFDERTDLGFIPDLASVQIDEFG
jgi:hypothetical protein